VELETQCSKWDQETQFSTPDGHKDTVYYCRWDLETQLSTPGGTSGTRRLQFSAPGGTKIL